MPLTQEQLTDLAIDRGAKLDLPEGVRHMLILIDGDTYVSGGAGVAMARDLQNPAEMLEAGAAMLRTTGSR